MIEGGLMPLIDLNELKNKSGSRLYPETASIVST